MELKSLRKEYNKKLAKECLALYKQGYNLRDIGKIKRISHEWVRQLIKSIPVHN